MKGIWIGLGCLTLLASLGINPASAQTIASGAPTEKEISTTPVQETPEMWLYQKEMQRYDSPKQAVRRKAEFASHQRQLRMAALKWYGMSNSRPVVNPTPWMGMYSPAWVSGTGVPFGWPRQYRSSTVIITP